MRKLSEARFLHQTPTYLFLMRQQPLLQDSETGLAVATATAAAAATAATAAAAIAAADFSGQVC